MVLREPGGQPTAVIDSVLRVRDPGSVYQISRSLLFETLLITPAINVMFRQLASTVSIEMIYQDLSIFIVTSGTNKIKTTSDST